MAQQNTPAPPECVVNGTECDLFICHKVDQTALTSEKLSYHHIHFLLCNCITKVLYVEMINTNYII